MSPVEPYAEQGCLCVAEHRPKCLRTHTHHIVPIFCGGERVPGNEIELDPTTHDNVHVIHYEFLKQNGIIPRKLGQPWYAYRLAVQGFDRMQGPS